MLFRRKGYFLKELDEKLIASIQELRTNLTNQQHLIENSVEPSDEFISQLKITEAKYYFLIKVARKRGVRIV